MAFRNCHFTPTVVPKVKLPDLEGDEIVPPVASGSLYALHEYSSRTLRTTAAEVLAAKLALPA